VFRHRADRELVANISADIGVPAVRPTGRQAAPLVRASSSSCEKGSGSLPGVSGEGAGRLALWCVCHRRNSDQFCSIRHFG
jgi:hypothetical protein